MFHWICPECGREIPPSVHECQHCDPQPVEAVAAAPPPEQPAAVEPVQPPVAEALTPPPVSELLPVELTATESAPTPVLELAPEPVVAPPPLILPVSEPVAEVHAAAVAEPVPVAMPEPEPVAAAPLAEPEPVVEAPPVILPVAETALAPILEPPPLPAAPEPLLLIAQEPVAEPLAAELPVESPELASPPEPVALEVATVAEPVEQPAAEVQTPEIQAPETEAVPQAAVEEAPEQQPLATEIPPPIQAATAPEPVEEHRPAVQAVAPSEPELKRQDVPDPLLALAEEIRAAQAARVSAAPPKIAEPPAEHFPEPAPEQAAGLAELAHAVEQHREPEPAAEPAAAQATEQSSDVQPEPQPAPAAVAVAEHSEPEFGTLRLPAAIQPEPAPQALAAPEPAPEGPVLPLAPMQKYTPATSKSIRPVSPPVKILGADIGPRITLPGPSLPPELTRLQDASPVTPIANREMPKAEPPAQKKESWLVTVLVVVLLTGITSAVLYFLILPRIVADAKPSSAPIPAEAATAPAPVKSTSPLAKFVEVTGFRIVVDGSKKSEVQYLVVNHSDADIADANVFVTLHGAKVGSGTVCRFSFKIPSLGPFEAKQMSSPIEKARTLTLPDWQDIRADVQISQ